MSDRELLELAAKAAGYSIQFKYKEGYISPHAQIKATLDYWSWWEPLTDDGDALRLMATLNINVFYRENINGAFVIAERAGINFCPESLDGPHEDAATRRAIVRAAAEIGKEQSG